MTPNTTRFKFMNSKVDYTIFVVRISQMFSQNTPRNTKHSPYTFALQANFVFHSCREKINRANADPGAKRCEMQKAKKGA